MSISQSLIDIGNAKGGHMNPMKGIADGLSQGVNNFTQAYLQGRREAENKREKIREKNDATIAKSKTVSGMVSTPSIKTYIEGAYNSEGGYGDQLVNAQVDIDNAKTKSDKRKAQGSYDAIMKSYNEEIEHAVWLNGELQSRTQSTVSKTGQTINPQENMRDGLLEYMGGLMTNDLETLPSREEFNSYITGGTMYNGNNTGYKKSKSESSIFEKKIDGMNFRYSDKSDGNKIKFDREGSDAYVIENIEANSEDWAIVKSEFILGDKTLSSSMTSDFYTSIIHQQNENVEFQLQDESYQELSKNKNSKLSIIQEQSELEKQIISLESSEEEDAVSKTEALKEIYFSNTKKIEDLDLTIQSQTEDLPSNTWSMFTEDELDIIQSSGSKTVETTFELLKHKMQNAETTEEIDLLQKTQDALARKLDGLIVTRFQDYKEREDGKGYAFQGKTPSTKSTQTTEDKRNEIMPYSQTTVGSTQGYVGAGIVRSMPEFVVDSNGNKLDEKNVYTSRNIGIFVINSNGSMINEIYDEEGLLTDAAKKSIADGGSLQVRGFGYNSVNPLIGKDFPKEGNWYLMEAQTLGNLSAADRKKWLATRDRLLVDNNIKQDLY